MRRFLFRSFAAFVLLSLAPLSASAQGYAATPSRCGEAFQPSFTHTSAYTFPCTLRVGAARAAAKLNASSICLSKLGSGCRDAVLVKENPTSVWGRRSERRCYVKVDDVFRCQAGGSVPDIAVTRFDASVTAAGAVTLHLTVCNRGGGSPAVDLAFAYPKVRFLLGYRCASASRTFAAEERGVVVPGGKCISASIPLGTLPAGRYTFSLWADPRCKLTELDETNNLAHAVADVAPGKSDVSISAKLTPGVTPPAGKTLYDVTICRTGAQPRPVKANVVLLGWPSTPKPDRYCRSIFDSHGTVDYGYLEFPATAGCATFYKVAVRAPAGPPPSGHSGWQGCFFLDYRCDLTESNEANNVACVKLP